MTITYQMKNATPDLVNTVILRKFFQMVFVGQDRKSLHIYTASVVGGANNTPVSPQSSCETAPHAPSSANCMCSAPEQNDIASIVSNLKQLNQFYMEFDFIVTGNDNNDVISIQSEDITKGERNFLSQINFIKQVWGNECEVIQHDQAKLRARLESFLGNTPLPQVEETASLAQEAVLWIEDKKKKQEPGMRSIAVQGKFSATDFEPDQKKTSSLSEGSERASYYIHVPTDIGIVDGIELVNWVKTTISFKHKFRDSNFNFCIQKDSLPEEQIYYFAPDFTWYFSPTIKSFIDNESSSVEIKTQHSDFSAPQCKYKKQLQEICGDNDHSFLECRCPIHVPNPIRTTTRHSNVINPVANKTTVNFTRWKDDEMISYRQKYRLSSKNIFSNSSTFNSMRELNIFLDTTDEHARGNRQYVLSIFISFALAFGIDSTRLAAAQPYFPLPNFLQADAWWLILLVLLSLNFLVRPPHTTHEHIYSIWRTANVWSCLGWIIAVFIVSKSTMLAGPFMTYRDIILMCSRCLYLILTASNFAYVFINMVRYHDPVLTSLFDDDIL